MRSAETQERVRSGIYFQVLSDDQKLKSKDPSGQLRNGIQGRNLEICCNFFLGEADSMKHSPKVVWMGKRWSIKVMKDARFDPPTVGFFVVPSELADKDPKSKPINYEYRFSVQVWPTGYWKGLRAYASLSTADGGQGHAGEIGTWEDVRISEFYLGSTGKLSVKVEIRLKKVDS